MPHRYVEYVAYLLKFWEGDKSKKPQAPKGDMFVEQPKKRKLVALHARTAEVLDGTEGADGRKGSSANGSSLGPPPTPYPVPNIVALSPRHITPVVGA